MTMLSPRPSALTRAEFVAAFGGVYEASPWVADAVAVTAEEGALDELDAMKAAMRAAVDGADQEKQMALVRAHPELAGRAAIAGDMTEESKSEQKGAGLDQCSPQEFADFKAFNGRYNEKFGFPFIIAVKGHDRQTILEAFRARLQNDVEAEFETALEQIHRIAEIRLAAMTDEAH